MNWNALVEWMGEAGTGAWTLFRDTYSWLAADDRDPEPAYRAVLRLSGLGYVEIDWDVGKWTAALPCVTLIPSGGGAGLLVGGRTRHLIRRIGEETDGAVTLRVMVTRHTQATAPDAFYFTADLGALEELAGQLGIDFEHSIATRLSRLLPRIDDLLALGAAEPPPQGFEMNRWGAPGMTTVTSTTQPGLYRSGSFGRPTYWFSTGEGHHRVDGPTGYYLELRRLERDVLRYKRAHVNGTLFRPTWAPLPLLQERTAVLCSGLEPSIVSDPRFGDRRFRYDNVPHEIAHRIAASLGSRLVIV